MKCVICKEGEMKPGRATVERDGAILVVKAVPATVCDVCGEEYVDEDIVNRLLSQVEEAARKGVQVHVQEFTAA